MTRDEALAALDAAIQARQTASDAWDAASERFNRARADYDRAGVACGTASERFHGALTVYAATVSPGLETPDGLSLDVRLFAQGVVSRQQ